MKTQFNVKCGLKQVEVAGAVLGTALALTVGAACAQSWNDTVAKAKKEGTVVLYTSGLGPTLQVIMSEFTKSTGIKVDGLMVNSGPQRQRVGRSVQAKQVQVDVLINNDSPFLEELLKMGELQDLKNLPEKARFPKEWWKGPWPIVGSFSQVLLVNTKFVDPKSIKVWTDILDPKYRDKIVIITPAAGLGVLTYYTNIIDSQGADFLKKLAAQNPTVVATSVEGSQLVAAGEKWIYTTNVAYNTVALKAKGAPVEDVYPPPISVVPYPAVALKNGPNPNAARYMVNWLLTKEGQRAICGQQRLTCSLPGIEDSLPLAKGYKIYDPNEVAARQETTLGLYNAYLRK